MLLGGVLFARYNNKTLRFLLILLSTHNAEKSIAMPETQEMTAQAMMPS